MKELRKLDMSFDYFWDLRISKLKDEMEEIDGELSSEQKRALEDLEDMTGRFDDIHQRIFENIR